MRRLASAGILDGEVLQLGPSFPGAPRVLVFWGYGLGGEEAFQSSPSHS